MTTTTETRTKTRPQWATVLAFGFFAAGFGVLVYAIGITLSVEGLPDIGFAIIAVGATVSLFGGAVYFLDR